MQAERLWAALEDQLPAAVALRHELHRHPEVSGYEAGSRDRVIAALPEAMRATRTDVAKTGAVLRLEPGAPDSPGAAGGAGSAVGADSVRPTAPAVGIRGELDALPIVETTGVAWQSATPGAMHACAHDVHMAAMTAVCNAVAEAGAPVPLLAVLQPREETYPSGAEDIVAAQVLVEQGCAAMVGAHIQPTLDASVVACVPGGVNAAADEFTIEVTGVPGHAAYPHLAADPVLALAQVVVALQAVVSRRVDPMRSAVLGVSSLEAGKAANVVPGTARATGTLRALDSETRELLQSQLTAVAESVAVAHGCEARVTVTSGEPVLDNHPELTALAQGQLAARGYSVCNTLRSLGADDFSFYGEQVPSLMMFVGTEASGGLHTAGFLPGDDDVRRVAEAMMAGYLAAGEMLAGPASSSPAQTSAHSPAPDHPQAQA